MKQFTLIIILNIMLVFISCTKESTTYKTRETTLFDYDWKFSKGDFANAYNVDFNDTDWRTINLPHDWSIETAPEHTNPMGMPGGFFKAGIGWYRKAFNLSEKDKDKRVVIYFEGVYMNSEVFINGTSLGIYPYGYSSFSYDLTPYCKFGEENNIAVKVDNSQQNNCRWYSGSGIYRHVWLSVTNKIYADDWDTVLTTSKIGDEVATVSVNTLVKNETDKDAVLKVSTTILDNAGIEITSALLESVTVKANGSKDVLQEIKVKNPRLWNLEDPSMYTAIIEVLSSDWDILDDVTKEFGIRSIDFSVDKGFVLNGKHININGGCVHHDNGSLGAAAYDRAEERKVTLLKEAGFNAVRTSHNPPSEAFLKACDHQGLLVIDESFDGWRESKTPYDYANYIDEWWKKDIDAMVKRDRNHPSIIIWSTGNEIIERTQPEAIDTGKKLADYIRSIDNTRPVTSAMTTWGQGWAVFDSLFAVHDVGGYNYQLHEAESDHERVPSRIIMQTESYPKDAFYVYDLVQKHPYIIGDFVWTAMDYLGESSIGRYYYPGEPDGQHFQGDFWPWHGAYCGDIDLLGNRKPISHYRSILWNNDEVLYMAVKEPNPDAGEIKLTDWAVWPTWERWTWPGFEGKNIEVEVYSKDHTIKLYLNDRLLGEKIATYESKYKAVFSVPYAEGVLKAVAFKDGKVVGESVLKTASKVTKIKAKADRSTLLANGQDLSFITIELVDENGTINPIADTELTFEIEGEGEIIAVDNASLLDTNAYTSLKRKSWNGKAMVVVKSTRKTGTIKLVTKAVDIPSTTITLNSIGEKN